MDLIISFLFVSIIGTLFHFTYDYFNHNKVVSIFSAVNESTWEHIKMGLSSALLFSIFDGFKYGKIGTYFFAKSVSLLMIILIIPILFYGFKLLFKRSFLIIDILIFYIATFLSSYLFYLFLYTSSYLFFYIIRNIKEIYILNYIGCIMLFIIFSLYLLLTIMPLKNELFLDPITKKYGLDSKR